MASPRALLPRGSGVQRQYVAMEHNTASLQNAQLAAEQAARAAETQYNTLTYKCEQEIRVRQQVMTVLKLERRFIISLTVIAGTRTHVREDLSQTTQMTPHWSHWCGTSP